MKLDVNGDLVIENIDQDTLIDSLGVLETPGGGFAVLSKSDVTYIYAEGSSGEGFQLEYQDGSLDRHYRSVDSNLELSLVINAFSQYLMGGEQWKYGIHWDRLIITDGYTDRSLTYSEAVNRHLRPRHNALPTLNSIVNEIRKGRRWWFVMGLGLLLSLIRGDFYGVLIFSIILILPLFWIARKVPAVLLLDRFGVNIKARIIDGWVDEGYFLACEYLHDHGVIQRISNTEYHYMEVGEEVIIRYLPSIPRFARIEDLSSR